MMNIESLRRKARKQGLLIQKRLNHITNGYMIVDENNIIQAGKHLGLSLAEVKKYLEE